MVALQVPKVVIMQALYYVATTSSIFSYSKYMLGNGREVR